MNEMIDTTVVKNRTKLFLKFHGSLYSFFFFLFFVAWKITVKFDTKIWVHECLVR